MKHRISLAEVLLGAIVAVHLIVSLAHGFAHSRAGVLLSRGGMLFVFGVILIGPVLGLVIERLLQPRVGAWIVAGTLAAALLFGLANHFLIDGADHVRHVPAPWNILFGSTAALLALTEALGSAVAVWCATNIRSAS